jgi:hypothetical protein
MGCIKFWPVWQVPEENQLLLERNGDRWFLHLMMRTWHQWIRPLIIRCACSYIYIVILDTIHGSTCTCRYLNVGTNVSQSASPSKLNFRFAGSPIVLHWEGHNSSIRSSIEVNEHLMESLFDKISDGSGPTSISHWQGLQIIEIFCRYFYRVLWHHRRLVIHTWDPGPSWSTP